MSGASIRWSRLWTALGLALLLPLAACGSETGFLVSVEIDPAYEPGRDFDHVHVQITPGVGEEASGQGLDVDAGLTSPYLFLILEGDVRRYTASVAVQVKKDGELLPWGVKTEANWEFKQGEIVEKTIRFDALPQ